VQVNGLTATGVSAQESGDRGELAPRRSRARRDWDLKIPLVLSGGHSALFDIWAV